MTTFIDFNGQFKTYKSDINVKSKQQIYLYSLENRPFLNCNISKTASSVADHKQEFILNLTGPVTVIKTESKKMQTVEILLYIIM